MKYLKLYWAFFRASVTADLEFRANFLIKVTTEIFWYAAQIVSYTVIFQHTTHIGTWTWPEMRVFLGILFLVDAIYMVIFSVNLDNFSETVRKGSLDLLLAKPVNSQFMVSLQRVSTANLSTLWIALAWLAWSLAHVEGIAWARLLWLLVAVPSGVAIFYSLRFMFSTMAVVYTQVESLNYLWYNFYRLGLRPDTIYVPWLRIILLSLLPVGLIASLPTRLVLGMAQSSMALWLAGTAALFLYLSHLFWQKTLRRYTSASS